LPTLESNRRKLALQAQRSIAAALNIVLPDETTEENAHSAEEPSFQSIYDLLLPIQATEEIPLQPK
jgi:hypothetical protein